MAGHCLVTLLGTHTPPQPFGAPNTVFDAGSNTNCAARFGCRTVVCTSSSASRVAMGHWGQCPHTPGMARHCLVTARENTILTIFMSVVFINFHQKFHTPEDLIRTSPKSRPDLGARPDLDSHLDPISARSRPPAPPPNARPARPRTSPHPTTLPQSLSRACRPRLRAEAPSALSNGLRGLRALRGRDDRSRS